MAPNFNDKDLVLSLDFFYSLKKGDVILVEIPKIGTVIKRVQFIENNVLKISGDNHEYTSNMFILTLNKNTALNDFTWNFENRP